MGCLTSHSTRRSEWWSEHIIQMDWVKRERERERVHIFSLVKMCLGLSHAQIHLTIFYCCNCCCLWVNYNNCQSVLRRPLCSPINSFFSSPSCCLPPSFYCAFDPWSIQAAIVSDRKSVGHLPWSQIGPALNKAKNIMAAIANTSRAE